jgi:hypothetical protein
MSNSIVLRTVYAVDSNTGNFISSGNVLVTDGLGGTVWSPLSAGKISQADLISTVCGLGTGGYISSATLSSVMISTVSGLGSSGYVSSSGLTSTVAGLATSGYVSTATYNANTVSTVVGLGSALYVSTTSLVSSVVGLGSAGYISSAASIINLTSTTKGLGSLGYISSFDGFSVSTNRGLGAAGYVSTVSLNSTLVGLGSLGYVSTNTITQIRFDTVGNVTTVNSSNTFTQVQNVIYASTFFTSSLTYTGNNGFNTGTIIGNQNMIFSTATINFSYFSSFINSNSKVVIDLYPNIAFTRIATGATAFPTVPISTFLQYQGTRLLGSVATSFLNMTSFSAVLPNGVCIDASNYYNTPIKLALTPGTISGYLENYTIMHYMPNSINYGQLQNALYSNTMNLSFGSTGSLFVSVQNTQ